MVFIIFKWFQNPCFCHIKLLSFVGHVDYFYFFSIPKNMVANIFLHITFHFMGLGFPGGSEVKASAWNVGDPGLIPGLGRSPGEGNGNPRQYSCLENPMEGGAW